MEKTRWLGFADNSGDEMTYFIKTEPESKQELPQYLTWSVICTRCKHTGSDQEYINEEPTHQLELEELELRFLNKSKEISNTSEHGQDKEPSDPSHDDSGEIHIQHNSDADSGDQATSEMPPGMNTNPGEWRDEEAMPNLLRRGGFADDKGLDVEDGDGENDLEESLPTDIK
eukprot:11578797-Ditylum_brightwellii.AAC.1